MSILYKFRSGTTYEALPLPGSAARLFDVKKAIVVAKKLDAGSMEFDLSVRNASTNEEYVDESMILPRGTRLIVQRLPAAKGQGFLARMARNQYGGAHGNANGSGPAPSGFYTIDSTVRDEEDEEFVMHGNNEEEDDENEDDKELAALKAVTETATAATTTGGIRPGASHFGRSAGGPAGQGPPPPRQQHHHQAGGDQGHQHHRPGQAPNNKRQRPDADPELREQDKKDQPKKRATGIPRTFLSLSAPSTTTDKQDGEDGEGNTAPMIQPNTIGFEELKSRGGGQSENASGTKKDLDYALKITDTTIPSYLKCGICQGVVKNAMFLSWDLEGRTACETCIRDALTKNGFRCPLTGQEGISPDDLHPNLAIRRAADEFVKGVMDKIEEIEKQGALEEAEQPEDQNEAANAKSKQKTNLLDGDTGGEKGVVVTKRRALANKRKAKEEDDPFAGDDEFGGDVFAIAAEAKPPVEEENSGTKTAPAKPEAPKPAVVEEKENKKAPEAKKDDDSPVPVAGTAPTSGNAPKEGDPARNDTSSPSNRKSVNEDSANKDAPQGGGHSSAYDRKGPPPPPPPPPPKNDSNRHQRPHYRRDNTTRQRRGPPAGYQMGPAGGATGPVASHDTGRSIDRNDRNDDDRSQDSRGFGRGGGRGGGRSPHGRFNADRGGFRGGRGRGRFNGGRFNGQDQRGRGDHYGGGRGQPRNTHSLSPENYSNGGGNEGRSNKRARHDSGDSFDGGRRQDNWDDRSAGSNDRQRQPHNNNNFRGRGFRGRGGPPRGGGRFDDRFDRGGGRGGGRFRGRGGGRFRGRGRY